MRRACSSNSHPWLARSRCDTCASTTWSPSPRRSSGSSRRRHTRGGGPYLDGVVFSATESCLVLGRQTDEPSPTSDYTGMNIYRSIQHDGSTTQHDLLTIKDYLWRWDTNWFWCSRAFGAQNPRIRRWWPKRLLRSSYWKLVALDHRHAIGDRIETRHGRPPRARGAGRRDSRGARSSSCAGSSTMCRSADLVVPIASSATPPHRTLAVVPAACRRNVCQCRLLVLGRDQPGQAPDAVNRQIEQVVADLGGHKSLYSDSFYDRATFDRLYGGAALRDLKDRYDPDRRLLDLRQGGATTVTQLHGLTTPASANSSTR